MNRQTKVIILLTGLLIEEGWTTEEISAYLAENVGVPLDKV
jgi:hypothetical protein